MNDRSRVGFKVPSGAMARALLAGLLLPGLTAGCDIFEPSSSEEIVLEPFETTWLVEPEPIDPATHPPEPPPPGEVLVDSLFYRADVVVEDTALGAGPTRLGLRVRLRNPFDDPVTIRVPECFLRPRAYATIDRIEPALWDPGLRDLGWSCFPAELDVTVPPLEEITPIAHFLPFRVSQGLPDGRYYFTLEFLRAGKEMLLFPAGSADVRYREPGLEFGVAVEDTGEKVRVEVRVTNRNDVPMALEWGGCSLKPLVLYRDAARRNLARELLLECLDFGRSATVAPGETIHPDEFIREFDLVRAGVLDLPPGTYFLSVRLRINFHDYEIPAGDIRLR